MRGQSDEDNSEDGSAAWRWEAMRHLYIEHQPKLRRFVARRVGGQGEAEDVCQEIWRVFYMKYDEYVASYGHAAKMLYPIAHCGRPDGKSGRNVDECKRQHRQEVPEEGEGEASRDGLP